MGDAHLAVHTQCIVQTLWYSFWRVLFRVDNTICAHIINGQGPPGP